jgi:hypothetical protein
VEGSQTVTPDESPACLGKQGSSGSRLEALERKGPAWRTLVRPGAARIEHVGSDLRVAKAKVHVMRFEARAQSANSPGARRWREGTHPSAC